MEINEHTYASKQSEEAYDESHRCHLSDNQSQLMIKVNGLATYLIKPLWFAAQHAYRSILPFHPGCYSQSESKIIECIKRLFILPITLAFILPATLPALIGFTLNAITYRMPSCGYTYFPGNAPPIDTKSRALNIATFNICAMNGPLPMLFGGAMPTHERIDDLVEIIQENPLDFFILEEVGCPEQLVEKLKGSYSYFFTSFDNGIGGSLFIATRLPLISPPIFTSFRARGSGMQWFFRRGFFQVETEEMVMIGTHLHLGRGDKATHLRHSQLTEIMERAQKKKKEHPNKKIILLGDFNADRLNPKEYDPLIELLDKYHFKHMTSDTGATATNALEIALFKRPQSEKVEKAIDHMFIYSLQDQVQWTSKMIDTKSASDHALVKATLIDYSKYNKRS